MDVYKIIVVTFLLFTVFLIMFAMMIYFINMKQQDFVLRSKINELENLISHHKTITENENNFKTTAPIIAHETAPAPLIQRMPINVPTRGPSSDYTIIGVLNDLSNKKILPLYGRKVYNGSSKWNYYTSTDGYNTLNLSILHKNKDCWDEYGCDEIDTNDIVYVSGYEGEFKVNLYKKTGPTYIPYI